MAIRRCRKATSYGQAVYVPATNDVFVIGGQTGLALDTATGHVWRMNLNHRNSPHAWKRMADLPSPRAFHMAVHWRGQLIVVGGRRERGGVVEFLDDCWIGDGRRWRRLANAPTPLMAGTAWSMADGKVYVFGAATGALFDRTDELKDKHPGFPRDIYSLDPEANRWSKVGMVPRTHVTTVAVPWGSQHHDGVVIPSGEVRPRVRSPQVLWIQPAP